MTVPRPITGSVGSRIRLVLGKDGDEWLLLLNKDDGNIRWQEKDWRKIPDAVARQINNCTSKGRIVKKVDFGPSGGWYVHGQKDDGSGGHCWWGGLDDVTSATIKENFNETSDCQVTFGTDEYGSLTYALTIGRNGFSGSYPENLGVRMKRINNRKKKINFIRLFHDGNYFISDEEGTEWVLGEHITAELKNRDGNVEDVALAEDGSWVVIRDNRFIASTGEDKNLTKALSQFYSKQRQYAENRRAEIKQANEAIERAAQEAREAAVAAREAAERELREAEEREAREAEERARLERERIQEAEHAARTAAAQLNAATRISALEAALENRFIEEAKDIKDMEEKLLNRKRSFREAMQSMPPETQSRISLDDENRSSSGVCVVCHDEPSVMAVIPCGHVCLCNTCSDECSLIGQTCPLCRGSMQSVLRIYWGN